MSRLACFFGWHRPYPGISRDMAFTWVCCRCQQISHGKMAVRR